MLISYIIINLVVYPFFHPKLKQKKVISFSLFTPVGDKKKKLSESNFLQINGFKLWRIGAQTNCNINEV